LGFEAGAGEEDSRPDFFKMSPMDRWPTNRNENVFGQPCLRKYQAAQANAIQGFAEGPSGANAG
jgi:hypothetical protein